MSLDLQNFDSELRLMLEAATQMLAESPEKLPYIANGLITFLASHYDEARPVHEALHSAMAKYASGEAWTLDDAFPLTKKKRAGKTKAIYRREWKHALNIHTYIEELRGNPATGKRMSFLDACEQYGSEHGMSSGDVKRKYYEAKKELRRRGLIP
jgi:hypothetical protein